MAESAKSRPASRRPASMTHYRKRAAACIIVSCTMRSSRKMADEFQIDVISDVVCPWCFIGQRRLAEARAQLPDDDPARQARVRWHPFQLNPDLPREGVPRKAYLEDKFGGAERAAQIYARVAAAGVTVGIPFAFERIERQPNTLDAHRLIAWAQARGDAGDLVERLFCAYFIEGRAIGERSVLSAIAGEAGFDAPAARAWLDSDEGVEDVARMDRRAREIGVGGVPFFIFNAHVAVSGAQEPDVLRGAMVQARGS
jgi:predicted DsbA family dithiol-disulfide isomerase